MLAIEAKKKKKEQHKKKELKKKIPCKKASNFCFLSLIEGLLGGFADTRALA